MARRKSYRKPQPAARNAEIEAIKQRIRLSQYARAGIDHKASLKGVTQSISTVNVDAIKNLLRNPESNHAQIGAYMEDLVKKNGSVGKIVNYFSTLPTYNHNIYPKVDAVTGLGGGVTLEDYLGPAALIDSYNLRFFVPYFVRQTLIHGATFFYEVSDNNGVAYVEFPSSMCRIYAQENGVYRWAINIDMVKPEMIEIEGFPEEIISAFEGRGNRTNDENYFDNKWYMLSDKAFAFSFNMSVIKNGGVSVSELVSLIIDSITIEKTKENVLIKDDIDTVRFLWGRVPTDKDGVPQMGPEEILEWQAMFESGLPNGVATVVTPFDMEGINLSNAGNKRAYETVTDAQTQLYASAGVPKDMFSGETKSSRIMELSITKDEAWVFSYILPVIESYYNHVLSQYSGSSGVTWVIKFLRQSQYNAERFTKNLEKSITLGASRTDYLASLGMSPIELISKLYMEQNVLDIDSLMVPKPISYTMSSSGDSEDNGRPKSDGVDEETERIQDSE